MAWPRAVVTLLCAAGTGFVWMLLTSPRSPIDPFFPGAGVLFNAAHAVLFGVQALLLGLALRPGRVDVPRRGPWLLASLVALLYSGALELVQGTLPGRSASWADMLTNAVGAFGVPWALATERPGAAPAGTRLFGPRTWIVAAASLACGVLATSTD